MKKIVLCLLFSAFIGACLGLYSFVLFNREDNVTVSSMAKEVCAIQIGVFESLDNANSLASKYGALVVEDNNKYRVYIAIVKDSLELIKKYYDNKKIPYYVRSIYVNDSFYDSLLSYENILLNSNEDNYENIISSILKKYKEDL